MNYNGIEITEITPDQWDGKSRKMLVWNEGDAEPTIMQIVGYSGCWIGYSYFYTEWEHCAEIPETTQQTVSLDECIEEAKVEFEAYPTNPNCEAAIMAYSTKMYLEDLKLKERRIHTAIRLIQNDQAFMAMDVLNGEDDSLLDTNPLKDYPPEDLDKQGYRKCFNKSSGTDAALRNETDKLRCALLHALSEVFRLKYEQSLDFEFITTTGGYRKRTSYAKRKNKLFRKYIEYRDAYKEAKNKLKD